jgi:hypothetical protein
VSEIEDAARVPTGASYARGPVSARRCRGQVHDCLSTPARSSCLLNVVSAENWSGFSWSSRPRRVGAALASPPMTLQTPGRLPAERPRISRKFIEDHRRRRCVLATAEILHEFGRRGLTTTNVVRLAGSSRATSGAGGRGGESSVRSSRTFVDVDAHPGLAPGRGARGEGQSPLSTGPGTASSSFGAAGLVGRSRRRTMI